MNPGLILRFSRWDARHLLGAAFLAVLVCGTGFAWRQAHPYHWGQNRPLDVAQKAVADYLSGKYNEAEAGFRAATFMEPTRMVLWYNLGNACFKSGNYVEALKAFQKAKSLDPKDPDVQHNLLLVEGILSGRQPSPPAPSVRDPGPGVSRPPRPSGGSLWQKLGSWFFLN